MKIEDVIATINRMEADGVVERYAIGNAVGARFYLEQVATLDIDIFYVSARGGVVEGEAIVIAGWPVQFLPAATPLLEEALREAVERDVDGIKARVFTAEHLAAIALQTGRTKDKARLLQFIEEGDARHAAVPGDSGAAQTR